MPNGGTLSIAAENLFIDENYARMYLDASVGPYIVVSVTDTGTSPEIVNKIFEPFSRPKSGPRHNGLSTVIGILKPWRICECV